MSRLLTSFLAIILGVVSVTFARADNILPGPSAPINLAQLSRGTSIPAAAWINQSSVTLSFQILGTGSTLTPQVELRPISQPFTGQPTHIGFSMTLSAGRGTTVSIVVNGLRSNTSYTWQARVLDASGARSPWTRFGGAASGAPAFSTDMTPPAVPVIHSNTNPRSGWWYNTRSEQFSWTSSDVGSGIAGYSYLVNHGVTARPGNLVRQTGVDLHGLTDGKWVLHVWGKDQAGNWSNEARYAFNLDTAPPKITFLDRSVEPFNPYVGTEVWRYTVDQWAHIVVDIRRSGQPGPMLTRDLGILRPGTYTYSWDGKTKAGLLAPVDWYWLHVTATDGVGNSSNLAFGGIHVVPVQPVQKRIVISLSRQTVTAYQNGRVVWNSLATTGNYQFAPTPAGHFHIFAKYSPYQFVSPWPPGDPLWYSSAWSTYAMEFISGGYFIHDAPWRNVFGPGSQAGGQPGTDYGGTHGCVNVPFNTAQFLYGWAPIGTVVDVVQ